MKKQITDTVLMIRPVRFRTNEETIVNNYFQKGINITQEEINRKAQQEFDTLVQKLREVGVHVIQVEDIYEQDTPDSIFPNNWISFHNNGDVAIYPMFAENRRRERREDILDIVEEAGFEIENVFDYTEAENEGIFLEGTGAMVLDRIHRKAYCALSPRASEELFIEFCEDFEYTPVIFRAFQKTDGELKPIYHTNVMMALGRTFAIVCLDTIEDKNERKNVLNHLKEDKKEIITISRELTPQQIEAIERHTQILYSDLSTIEICGGGSARCMLAEVFLPHSK